MISTRKCNNNIIFALDNDREVIVLGKGIGFNCRPGDEVDINLVEKVFVPQEAAQFSAFKDILADLPYELIILAGKIVDHGKTRLGQSLNQSILIALADHLNFVFTRLKDKLDIQDPLAWDIQHIYPAEYALGQEILRLIKEETGVCFPDAEAAAIALHFINAESDRADMPNTIKISQIITGVVGIVESQYQKKLNVNTPDFNGFVTLLRNTIMRFIYNSGEKQAEEDTALYHFLRKRYAFEFNCAEKIAAFIESEYGWQLVRNDVSFLALYISRITAGGGL